MPPTERSTPVPPSTVDEVEPPARRQPRRWRRRALWALLALLVLAPVVNGPVFRKVVRWQLDKALDKLSLSGDYQLSGTLISGLAIDDVDLTGTRNVRRISADHLDVEYRIGKLISGSWGEGITRAHVDGLDVLIDNSTQYPPAEHAKKKKKQKDPKKLWSNLHALLQQDLAIRDLELRVKKSGQADFHLQRFSLVLDGGGGSVTAEQIALPSGEVSPPLEAELITSGDPLVELSNLKLADDLAVHHLSASSPAEGFTTPRLTGRAHLFGGEIDVNVVDGSGLTITQSAGKIDVNRASQWIVDELDISGSITGLAATVDPAADYLVEATLETEALGYGEYASEQLSAEIAFRPDRVELRALEVTRGANRITATGSYEPGSKSAEAKATVVAPELDQLGADFGLPEIGGSLGGEILLAFADGDFSGSHADLSAEGLRYEQDEIRRLGFQAHADSNDLIKFEVEADVDGDEVNTISAAGAFTPDEKSLQADGKIEISDLSRIAAASDRIPELGGSLSGEFEFALAGGQLTDTRAKLTAGTLDYRGAALSNTKVEAHTTAANQFEFSLESEIDHDNQFSGTGSFDLDALEYRATAKLDFEDLEKLHQHLGALELAPRPTGNVELAWSGEGSLREKSHRGSAQIPSFDYKPDSETSDLTGKLELDYAPDSFHLRNLDLRSEALSITGAAQLIDRRLEIDGLRLFNQSRPIASADVSLPFDIKKLANFRDFFDQPGELSIKIDSEELQLGELIAMTGKPSPIAATLDASIDIGGTLSAPSGNGQLELLQVRSTKSSEIAPADLRLGFGLDSGRLELDGKLEHPELEPITITGTTPMHVEELDRFGDQPIDLAVKLPETDLSLAKKYVPAIVSATGHVSADIRITGSVSSPQLAGGLSIDSPLLKFEKQQYPTISDLLIKLDLEGDRLDVSTFRAFVAGGEITLAGETRFPTLTEPEFDLALTARQALILRNDNLSLRANADISLAGPIAAAAITGKVGITQSRFYREIEILPIGLPRSAPTPGAPKAPSFGGKHEIGVSTPPLDNWTVDLKIVTDDPFLIRSNLATADVVSDLHIGGTLGKPVPKGVIELSDGVATLPFSELRTTEASLTFSERLGFDPTVNVRAHSRVQDYKVTLIAYGLLSSPKTLITSDPPLPESDAISLLATGSKASDLSSGEVIAGDAALLLIDKVRRRLTKGTALERSPGQLRDQLSFKAGQIDARTGQRSASATLKLTDNVYLLGNVNVEGDYRGLVNFIFRFK